MFPSNQSGIGINSSFGLVPLAGRGGTSSTDETRSLAFNWLSHLSGPGVGLSDDQQAGLKVTSDQIMDRSFMSIDRHTPSIPRRTPHSNVGGASGQPGSDAPQHPIQDASMVNTFHPYRLVSDGLSAAGHPSLSTSQFAAFDSLYKAYQGAYGSATPAGVFGTQPFRFDSPLLADQRMMLQASLLQYPHLGIFPSPALYPGLPGAGGVRYPGDYYGQNIPGMQLSSKYSDVGGPSSSWLGLDRSMPQMDRDKDMKDGERKTDLDLSKRPDKDDHHRSRSDREDMVAMRRDLKDEARRCEQDSRRDPSKHTNDKDSSVKKDQQKRSNSLKSPIRQEGHHSSSLDGNMSRCNSGGPSDFSFPSGRVGHVMPGFTMSSDISNLPKVSSSPGGATSQQRQTAVRNDRSMEPVQDHTRAKDRHHHHHHHHHHHGWKAEESKSKMVPLVLTVPKTTASTNTNGQQLQQQLGKPSSEKKFHRPFEQTQMNCATPAEKHGHAQKDGVGKNCRVASASSDFLSGGAVSDSKTGDFRFLQHQYQMQQQQRTKGFETKAHPHSASAAKKQGALRCEDAPLNLVMTKSQNFAGTVAHGPTLTDVVRPPLLGDGYEFPRAHRAPPPPVVPAHPPLPDADFHAQTWGLASPEDVRLVAKPGEVPSTIALAPSMILAPVSKLDLETKRRTKVRKNEGCNSEDEEEEEDEDVLDNSKDTARLLFITSGPPLKDPITVAKSNYLSQFGLVSLDSSREIAFEQRRKRRKLFRERSISPTLVEDGREPEHEDVGSAFRNEINRLDKHSFLSILDLESVRLHPKKRKVMPGGRSEREDLAKFYRAPTSSSHSNEPALNSLQNQLMPGRIANSQYNSSMSQLDPKHQDTCPRPRVENSLGSSIVGGTTSTDMLVDRRPFASVSDAAAFFTGESADRWPQQIDGDRSSRDSKHAEFVKPVPDGQSVAAAQEEYRHAVPGGFPLLSSAGDGHCATRDGQLDASPFNINSRNASTPSSLASREVTNGQTIRVTDHQCHEPAFHWPGLEAVIESYHHYVEEQGLERQLLREQSQRLRQHHADLMITTEQVRTHMSDLLYSKQQLVEERHKVQTLIDGLKNSLKPFL